MCRYAIAYCFAVSDKDLSKCLIPLSHPDSWKDFKYTIKIGWESFLLRVMGWWAFDVFTQLASMLTETDTAGQTILRNIGLFTYMIPVGLCQATNFLTGKYIGKDRADLAHKISNLCMFITLLWSFASMILVYHFQE